MLHRKKVTAGLLCILAFAAQITAITALSPNEYFGGWGGVTGHIPTTTEFPNLLQFPAELMGAGSSRTRLLYRSYERLAGAPYVPRDQGEAPSCVGQAMAACVDFLAAVEVVSGEPERLPPAYFSAEVVYGLSRQEIANLGRNAKGGANCIWACQACSEFGMVPNLRYPLLGIDLSNPSPSTAIKYGMLGCPDRLERIAKLHPIQQYLQVRSYEDVRDAIYSGMPIIVGSNQGFGSGKLRRDRDGFLNPPKRFFFPSTWNHAMAMIAVCDEGRKGVLILNSWGPEGENGWISGPKRFGDEPDGSFWADARIIDSMVKQGDSYALVGFKGYAKWKIR